jgi:hypothetical protein
MSNINVDDTYIITENVENVYYCIPIVEDGQWDDVASWMGMVKSLMVQEDPLIADPFKELYHVSSKKVDNVDLSDWIALQEQAKTHNRQMKELTASHRQQSVQAEANNKKWDPLEIGPNEQANKMAISHHGLALT